MENLGVAPVELLTKVGFSFLSPYLFFVDVSVKEPFCVARQNLTFVLDRC